ncbi:hypothetical protein [Micromonospora sp. NPDC005174]|uniref:hypothetical protein n=1 Tax=Micromonospora sp. NPDC005174 TaxID=3157018 RepID=UPI0033B14A19
MTETPEDLVTETRSDNLASTGPDSLVPIEELLEDGLERLADAVSINRNIASDATDKICNHVAKLRISIKRVFEDDEESIEAHNELARLDKAIHSTETLALYGTMHEVVSSILAISKIAATAVQCSIDFTQHFEFSRRAAEFEREKILHGIEDLDLLLTRSELSETAREVRRIAGDVQEAAGDVAQSELAAHYQEGAAREGRRYLHWNVLFGTSIVASVALASFLISQTPQANWTAQETTRITIAIPLLIFAIHSSRQSRFHRDAQAALGLVAVKLKTVRAFADSLDLENRQELLTTLGKSIFSTPEQSNSSDTGQSPITVPELIDLLRARNPAQSIAGDASK